MPRKMLTKAERNARAERNRMAKVGLAEPSSERAGIGGSTPQGIQNNLKQYTEAIERLNKVPTYAGGEYLTAEQIKAVCEVVEIGNFPHHVATYIGIPENTWKMWMSKGRQGIEPYGYIYQAVQAARSRAIVNLVARLRAAGDVAWQANARMLESFAADDWQRSERRVDEAGESYRTLLNELAELRKSKATPVAPSPQKDSDQPYGRTN